MSLEPGAGLGSLGLEMRNGMKDLWVSILGHGGQLTQPIFPPAPFLSMLDQWQPWGHLTQIHGAPSTWQKQRSNWF